MLILQINLKTETAICCKNRLQFNQIEKTEKKTQDVVF